MLAPHAYHFVDDIQPTFWYVCSGVLLTNNFTNRFEPCILNVETSLDRCSAKFCLLLFLQMFINVLFALHQPVVILPHNFVCFSMLTTLWASTGGWYLLDARWGSFGRLVKIESKVGRWCPVTVGAIHIANLNSFYQF